MANMARGESAYAAAPAAGTSAAPSERIGELQRLTSEYASYSRSRAGLGNVLGGVIGLIVFGAVWALGGGFVSAIIVVGLTTLWLVGREVIRRRLYQRFGQAQEVWTGSARKTHIFMASVYTLAVAAFAAVIIFGGWLSKPVGWPYLIFCLVTPWLVWRTLYTLPELILGFTLLFMGAITASGHTPDLLALLVAPAYALAMIPLGLSEHCQFRRLEAQIRARSGENTDEAEGDEA